MSALLPASLGTKFLKLPAEPQTLDSASTICEKLSEIELKKGDFVYLDLLSNIIYTGTDEYQIPPPPPHKDGNRRWHLDGSLGICTKHRIKKILANWEDIK